jgi:hypothetical protein
VKGGFADMMKLMQKIQGEEHKRTVLGHIRLMSDDFAYRFIKQMEVNKDFKDYLARTNSAAYARLVNGTGMTDIGGLMG